MSGLLKTPDQRTLLASAGMISHEASGKACGHRVLSELRPQKSTEFIECLEWYSSLAMKLPVSMPSRRRVLEKHLSLFWKRKEFSHRVAETKMVAQFVKSTTETCCGFEGSKAAHGIIALFDPMVILFEPIIEIRVRPMVDLASHRFTNGSGIRRCPSVVIVSGHDQPQRPLA